VTLRQRNIVSVLVLGAAAALAIFGIYKALFPAPGDGYIVKAEFKDAGGLTKNSDVKIGGVPGGRVTSIDLSKRDTAIVTMDLKKGAHPIGAGARADSRPVNLLGEKYVDLQPGNLSKPEPSGTFIPMSRTSRPVELDDVLNMMQPDVRARMRILINEAGISMDGRSADFNSLLDSLPPALDQSRKLIGDFSADNQRLGQLIDKSDRVLAAFASKKHDLQGLVGEAADTLKVTASKRKQIAQTIKEAPATLAKLRSTLGELQTTATRLKPTAAALRQASPPLADTMQRLPAFAKDAAPTLDKLSDLAPTLTKLGVKATPVLNRLEPTTGDLVTFADRLQPIMDTLSQDGGAKNLIGGTMQGWANAISHQDGLGHYFRTQLVLDRTLIEGAVGRYLGVKDSSDNKEPQTRKADKKPKLDLPAAVKSPKDVVPKAKDQVKKVLDDTLKTVDKTVKGVTDTIKGATKGVTDKLPKIPGLTAPAPGAQPKADGQGKDGAVGQLLDYLLGS
jgi:phospholipid/cholesterol/gamma-HCH transport system substrate-binding protein